MTGWLVTVNDIKNWTETNKRRAEEILPLLVKKLILASCKPKAINFPSGDNVVGGEWDGMLEIDEGNEFIPSGKSGWEFGTNSNVKKKADDDYSKRLKNPTPFVLDETTFVFVTSRLWTKRDKWVQSKQSAKKWKAVKGINAETLTNWLEACPAVHRWFSEMLGKRYVSVWDVEQAWHEYTNKTSIKLNAEFFLHEREKETKLLSSLISGNAEIHRIKATSKSEAYGFILATLLSNESANSRCLVIRSQEAWDLMAASNNALILVPNGFLPSGIGAAVSNGHSVLLAVGDKDTHSESIRLNRQPRLIREDGLKKLGFSDDEVRELYHDTKGYLEPLLRHNLLQPIDYTDPKWPSNSIPDVLFAALFASEWNENNEHDREAMEALAGLPYSEFQKYIISLSKEDDPPIRQVGEIWQIISKMDFWLLVAPRIAKPYLKRLGEVVPIVLADINPSYDLPADERHMASIKGAIPKYSGLLKKGVADSLALLSVYGDEFSDQLGGEKPSLIVRYCIRKIFKENKDIKFWFSLGSCTRLLAEAAPDEFVSAVESASTGDTPVLLGLFEVESEGIFGNCYHSDLLWALELISWNTQYLAKVSLCLARLSAIDPGGKWSNRPFNSLVDMYIGWINNTSATHEERLQIIEKVLIPQYPEIAWRLMIALLINNMRTTSGICKPVYRDWSNIERGTTKKNYFEYVRAIVDILLQEVDKNVADRIVDLIDNFTSLNEDQRNSVLERMLAINVNEIGNEPRKKILNKVRRKLAHHREIPDAKWAWPSTLLDRLEEVYAHFDFADVVNSNSYLFDDHWPNLIDPIKRKEVAYEEQHELLARKRISAIEAIYANFGTTGVEDLLLKCSFPRLVGYAAFKSSLSEVMQSVAISWLDAGDSQREFSEGFISALAHENCESAKQIIEKNDDWSPIKKARFLLCMPLKKETLKFLDAIPAEGRKLFWSKLNYYSVSDKEVELVSYIASKLLENDRPLAAVDALAQVFYGKKHTSDIDSSLVADILIRIATDSRDIERISIQNVRYDILKAIEFLQDAGEIAGKDILQIEWAYLKIFRFEEISPRYLMKSIAEDPLFFAQLVIWVFKRNDNKEDSVEDLTEDLVKQRAEIAWELLDTISILPGQKGNQIDENVLSGWIDSARDALKSAGRLEIGDDMIGKYLSRCPSGKDNIWPHESVRSVIERVKSKEIDEAMAAGRENSRGVTTRHPYAGGKQERVLATKYHSDAESIQLTSPRTADILKSIAKSYEWDADREDREVELRG